MRSFLALSFLFAAALAQDITVTNSGLAGSGCAPGGSTITHDGTNRKIKVHAQGLIAEVGPVVPLSESSRNCKLTVGVNIPAGFTVDFETVTAKIAYSAGNEVLLAMNALAQWNGQLVPSTGLARVNGPVWDRQATMAVDLAASPMPGPCGGASTANVGVELRATRYDEVSSGYIDGNVEWDVSYKLKACSPSGGGPTPL
ncbi:hypothetical protein BKA70DRAFT_1435444 [Coprinopsis sp. MPI-PUGE-AT-0042]|nr:hypothetical protein BKA70DRAFT_1435444 [Coprinopsis sp. MPI-PUGE-AT-0042]